MCAGHRAWAAGTWASTASASRRCGRSWIRRSDGAGDLRPDRPALSRLVRESEHRAQALHQGLVIEGLGDIAVGPSREPAQYVLAAGLRGEHDDRDLLERGVLPDARQDIETVGAGQVDVQQDRVRQGRGPESRDDLIAVARDARLVALEFQQHPY